MGKILNVYFMGDFYLVGGNLSSLLYGQIFIFLGSFSVWAILCMGNLKSIFLGQFIFIKVHQKG